MYRNMLLGIITALSVMLLIAIYLLGSQWFEEGQGDELFRKAKYEDAAEHFLMAYKEARFVGQGRLLYKIALSFQNARDYDRARDFYVELVSLYPDAPITKMVGPRLDEILRAENSGLVFPESIGGMATSGVQNARSRYMRAFQNLSRLLKANRAGVPADLEASYAAYKIYHAEYKKQIALALDKYREEHPGFVWPPPGAATGPDPVSLQLSSPAPGALPPGAKKPEPTGPAKPESRPADIDRELTGAGGSGIQGGP